MTGRGMALIAAVRRALARQAGAASVRVVRDRKREDIPLGQQTAHLIEPLGSERLSWPESDQWQYELAVMELVTLGRGRSGDRVHHQLAECHEAALALLADDAELTEATCDAPPSSAWRAALGTQIAALRWGRTECDAGTPGGPLCIRTTLAAAVMVDAPHETVLLDQAPLASSGPHALVAESPQRLTGQRLFNGLSGALLTDLGPRPRTIVLRGRLMAASAAALAQLEAAIEARVDGLTHTVIDGLADTTLGPIRLEKFVRRSPVERGRCLHRQYDLVMSEMAPPQPATPAPEEQL